MKTFSEDLRRIRWNLLLFMALVLIGSGAVYASLLQIRDAQQVSRQALARQNEVQGKLANARNEEQELRQKFSRYENLLSRGYIGTEHRLEWIEQIRKIKTARKMLDIQYELAPQQKLDNKELNPSPAAAGSAGTANAASTGSSQGASKIIGYDFMVSNMSLHMQLLHEEDLLNFIADLNSSILAYIRVNKCEVQRQSFPGSAAQLKAECSIDWITLRENYPG